MRLGPVVYDSLQTFINGDFSRTANLFESKMAMNAGDTVVDIGCGTGLLARAFLKKGYRYFGFDFDKDRIETAKARCPQGSFFSADVRDGGFLTEIQSPNYLMHGLIHHLSDDEVRGLIGELKSKGCKAIGMMDPVMPDIRLRHPLATLLCQLDEGEFVRTSLEYQTLLSSVGRYEYQILKTPRWPVPLLYGFLFLEN